MIWTGCHPKFSPETLGLIPSFLDETDPRPAKQQIDANYQHGGGWRPIEGFKFNIQNGATLTYPEDPPYRPLAMTRMRDEIIIFYDCAMLMILQLDGSFEVARLD
jgi:hypothetical protein